MSKNFDINEAESEHLKALSSINKLRKKDEALIKNVFPNGCVYLKKNLFYVIIQQLD